MEFSFLGFLYRGQFVFEGAFLLGGFLTGGLMVRLRLSEGLMPGFFDLEPYCKQRGQILIVI